MQEQIQGMVFVQTITVTDHHLQTKAGWRRLPSSIADRRPISARESGRGPHVERYRCDARTTVSTASQKRLRRYAAINLVEDSFQRCIFCSMCSTMMDKALHRCHDDPPLPNISRHRLKAGTSRTLNSAQIGLIWPRRPTIP